MNGNDRGLFILVSLIIFATIRSCINAIIDANIGKKNKKNYMKTPRIVERIFMTYAVRYAKKYARICKAMVLINFIYIVYISFTIAIILLYNSNQNYPQLIHKIVMFKTFVLDLPIFVFYVLETRYENNRISRGRGWRFK